MSKTLAKLAAMNRPRQEEREPLAPDQQKALDNMRAEAKAKGATLHNDGEGGLDATLALGVMRRDKYTCKKCGSKQDITLHHKGHLKNPVSRWLKQKGRDNGQGNIVVLCAKCHDQLHAEDEGKDK
jgi:5-methylcytosine-specific restriction endonuclease McrA